MKLHPLSKVKDANLVFHIANRFMGRAEFDDLVSEGMIGLLNAKKNYNRERGPWGNYAYRCILHRMHEFSKNNRSLVGGCSKVRGTQQTDPEQRRKAEAASVQCWSLDSPIQIEQGDKDNEKTLYDVLPGDMPAPDEMASRLESVRRVRGAMQVLGARDFKIVSEVFDNSERAQRVVGAFNGISKRRVEQILERALYSMACELAKHERRAA